MPDEFNEDDAVYRMYFKRLHEMPVRTRSIEAAASMMAEAYYRGRSEAINVVREEVRAAIREGQVDVAVHGP